MDHIVPMIQLLLPLLLLLVAFVAGGIVEKKHYQSIARREQALAHIIVVSSRRPSEDFGGQFLVRGSVVVSSDYFRRFLALFRHIFGGHVRSYERLLERARREAVLRLKEQAAQQGADIVFNLKMETSSLSTVDQGRNGGVLGTVEVLAYGTAGRLGKNQGGRGG